MQKQKQQINIRILSNLKSSLEKLQTMIEDFHYSKYLDQVQQVNRAKEHLRLNHASMNPHLK